MIIIVSVICVLCPCYFSYFSACVSLKAYFLLLWIAFKRFEGFEISSKSMVYVIFCFPFFMLQCARQGFALGLTMLVGTVPSIKLDSLLKLIINLLEVLSSMKGQVGSPSV